MGPGPTLRATFSSVVETVLNQVLRLDSAGSQALLAQLDRAVTVRLDPPGWDISVSARGERIGVSTEPAEDAALELAGSPLAFAALLTGEQSVFHDGRLRVTGDVALAQGLQTSVMALDLDWEGELARHLGDLPAHFIGQRVRHALRWTRQAQASLTANLEEYLQEESQALPARLEADAQFEDIDTLRLAVDRIAARIDAVKTRVFPIPPTPESNSQ
ncbi:ubiquinone biosynthesis accessory factor UbiJ [Mangrovitalea sediminis]|uniref:ubiquinone biosynthesis accessory factor UbiJ n=1 Tax=Mangrovitalea sediminis TaxID=1982043 RepID=UPI000BE5E1B7|nr:SCP2 sterol-binding domain-containing protein [Mangrovitalea sediminis]